MKWPSLKYQTTHFKLPIMLLIVASFVSCRPKGILHSWEMRDLLVDLHKADAVLQISNIPAQNTEVRRIYYAQVLEKHGVTQTQFDSSLVWYTAHPQLFDKIYPKVLAELQKEEDQFIAAHQEELSLHPDPFAFPPQEEKEESKPFSQLDLDSVLWTNHHGMPNSWNNWIPPYRIEIGN